MAKRGSKLLPIYPSADNAIGLPMVAEYGRRIVARKHSAWHSEELGYA